MENTAKNIREENRRIVQDGLDRRAEVRAIVAQEARMEAYERDMIKGCNENSAKNRALHMATQSSKETRKNELAVMEDPKAKAAREKAATWLFVKQSFFILTSFATVLLILRFAEDFGASVATTINLAALAIVIAIARLITINRQAFYHWRKRRAVQ